MTSASLPAPRLSPTLPQRVVSLWWERLPRAGGRVAGSLPSFLIDGVYLVAWPRLAAALPPLALVLGALSGWLGLGADTIFTQSAAALSLAIGLGYLSAQLGLLFTLGYAIARLITIDAVFSSGPVTFAELRVAVLIAATGLAALAAGMPLLSRLVAASLASLAGARADIRFVTEVAATGLVAAALSYLQLQALPMFVRPVFVWQGTVPPVASIAPVQQRAWLFALLALLVGGARVVIEYVATALDGPAIEARLWKLDSPQPSWWERLPIEARLPLGAAAGTLLLSGLLMSWTEAGLLFAGQLGIVAAREALSRRMPVWPRLVQRLPTALRLVLALTLSYLVMSRLLRDRLFGVSFLPLIWSLLAALGCVAALFPRPLPPGDERAATSGTRGGR